jgi:hypothetical protein
VLASSISVPSGHQLQPKYDWVSNTATLGVVLLGYVALTVGCLFLTLSTAQILLIVAASSLAYAPFIALFIWVIARNVKNSKIGGVEVYKIPGTNPSTATNNETTYDFDKVKGLTFLECNGGKLAFKLKNSDDSEMLALVEDFEKIFQKFPRVEKITFQGNIPENLKIDAAQAGSLKRVIFKEINFDTFSDTDVFIGHSQDLTVKFKGCAKLHDATFTDFGHGDRRFVEVEGCELFKNLRFGDQLPQGNHASSVYFGGNSTDADCIVVKISNCNAFDYGAPQMKGEEKFRNSYNNVTIADDIMIEKDWLCLDGHIAVNYKHSSCPGNEIPAGLKVVESVMFEKSTTSSEEGYTYKLPESLSVPELISIKDPKAKTLKHVTLDFKLPEHVSIIHPSSIGHITLERMERMDAHSGKIPVISYFSTATSTIEVKNFSPAEGAGHSAVTFVSSFKATPTIVLNGSERSVSWFSRKNNRGMLLPVSSDRKSIAKGKGLCECGKWTTCSSVVLSSLFL